MSRDDFIKQLATELGYRRVSSNIRTHLSGHLRAAVRRHILQTKRGEVEARKTTITDFTDDDLRRALISVTRRRTTCDRTDLMRTIARHLGFGKLTAAIKTRLKSTLNFCIHCKILERVGAGKGQSLSAHNEGHVGDAAFVEFSKLLKWSWNSRPLCGPPNYKGLHLNN